MNVGNAASPRACEYRLCSVGPFDQHCAARVRKGVFEQCCVVSGHVRQPVQIEVVQARDPSRSCPMLGNHNEGRTGNPCPYTERARERGRKHGFPSPKFADKTYGVSGAEFCRQTYREGAESRG